MAAKLPFFKFVPAEWISGDITTCSMEAQGVFTNLVAFYWKRDCIMTLVDVQKRFENYPEELEELMEKDVFLASSSGEIHIKFLDEQRSSFGPTKPVRMVRTRHCIKDVKERERERKENKKKINKRKKIENIIPPKLEWVVDYCEKRNNGIDPVHWFNSYKAKGWMIGNSKMRDWHGAVHTWEQNKNKYESKQKQTSGFGSGKYAGHQFKRK